jgi:glycosyltransferase involved in cell wall biosynthesis
VLPPAVARLKELNVRELSLVVTTDKGGLDRYSLELAKRLPLKIIETSRHLNIKEKLKFFKLLSSLNAPVLFPNQHFGRFANFLKVPFIITVHDLARIKMHFIKETLKERTGLWLDKKGIKKANIIIAISEYTKKDLVEFLKIPFEKVEVIYNGIDLETFKPSNEKPFDFPYIIYAGSERPRKNLGRLLEAFARIKKDFPELKFVKVGLDAEGGSANFRTLTLRKIKELGLEREVIFTEQLEDEELAKYYSGALLLAYPSLYEGFGFPPLEAMACGCPAIVSNVTSLPEVIGDAGILFDPYNIDEIAQAMRKIIEDEKLREKLMKKGFEQVRKFNWDETAERTYKLCKKLLKGGGL